MIIKNDNEIIIKNELFSPKAILQCGQAFRFNRMNDDWIVYSMDKKATIRKENENYVVYGDSDYFYNYFDLDNDYKRIIENLQDKPLVNDALTLGKDIRILKQDPFETIIEFIISANNHIPRIKGIIERLCYNLGENKGDYYAFPSIERMAKAGKDFYTKIGCGYRDEYLSKTALAVYENDFDIRLPYSLNTEEARKYLMRLSGVGPKVSDCILLFGYQKYDVFPVDTWIKKLYFTLFPTACPKTSVDKMRRDLVALYGEYSGIAQQYLFYSLREKEIR